MAVIRGLAAHLVLSCREGGLGQGAAVLSHLC